MTPPTLAADPPCPPAASADERIPASSELRVQRVSIADVSRETWDAAAARNPWATPFSGWAFQRAWWDAYGANAHEETLVLRRADAPADAEPVAIVPLMHRHEVEPSDAVTHTTMRHGADLDLTPGRADRDGHPLRCLVPRRLRHDPGGRRGPAGGRRPRSSATWPKPPSRRPWDVVDLRRLRCGDPAADALAAAFGAREIAEGWTLDVEREDVCPVVDAADRGGHRGLPRDARQEGASRDPAQGPPGRGASATSASTTRPIRWPTSRRSSSSTRRSGATTACSPTRRAAPRAACSSGACSSSTGRTARCACRSCRSAAGGSRPGSTSNRGDGYLYYNAGVDPDARDLSPGVVMVYALVERALGGRRSPARLPARQRAVQVRVGRGRRADPAPARPPTGTADMSAPLPLGSAA